MLFYNNHWFFVQQKYLIVFRKEKGFQSYNTFLEQPCFIFYNHALFFTGFLDGAWCCFALFSSVEPSRFGF